MTGEGNGVSRYRIEELERKVRDLSQVRTRIALLERQAAEHEDDVSEIKAEFKSVRRGLWAAAGTFALFAVTVFTVIVQRL